MNRFVRTAPLLSLAIALTACTSTPTAPPMSDPLPPTAARCQAEAARSYVGQPATPQNVDAARVRAGAHMARVLKPDQVITMEYRGDRLNVYVDASNVITRIACG